MVTSPQSLPPHPSRAYYTDNSGWFSVRSSRYKWNLATITTSSQSPCDPSCYKWLPHHTHYLLSPHPSLAYNTDNSGWFSVVQMVQRAIPRVINGYLTALTTSSSITGVQHGQQRMVQRAIPSVINGYLATITTSSSITSVQHGQ
ncbi:hypothetical protein J6590_052898 [Homalodisca vitripennis]|nr:hypothetical protein J6590_052898 [Homalodisca vitripennis]